MRRTARQIAGISRNGAVANKYLKGFDPVTEADREAEQAIRRLIREEFPDHGPAESLAHEIPELLRHLLQEKQRGERRQREDEGADVLAKDVAGEELQGLAGQGCGGGTRPPRSEI